MNGGGAALFTKADHAITVVQFVEFSTLLLKTSTEFYNSNAGAANGIPNLQVVYEKLHSCSLESTAISHHESNTSSPPVSDNILHITNRIRDLAMECRTDCDKILPIVGYLKLCDGTKTRWASLSITLNATFKGKEIPSVNERF